MSYSGTGYLYSFVKNHIMSYISKTLLIAILVIGSGINSYGQTLEQQARERMDSLLILIDSAESVGISTVSERMTLRTAEIYLKFADWDEANTGVNQEYFGMLSIYRDNAAQMAADLPGYERSQVNQILSQAITRLSLVLDSVYTRKRVPMVDWSTAQLNGNTIIQDGRPVFLLDHTWKPATAELQEYFGALDGYYISPSHVQNEYGGIKSWIVTDLNKKPGGNIGSIFIDHSNIPGWAKEKYDNFTVSSRLFSKYDIDHPGAREMYGFLFSGTVPKMAGKNYTGLGYMLFNEPSFFTQSGAWNTGEVSEYTKEKFRGWLSRRHDSIQVLNDLWGTGFEHFDSVTITIPISATHEGTPMWYDWLLFNNHRVTDYFRFLKNEIRKHDPHALVHIKLMPWLWTGDKKDHGIDFEALTRLCDISGSDAQAKNSKMWGALEPWTAKYAFEWLEISMTYDFFRSVQPDHIIFDTENHFLSTNHFRDLYLSPDYARATYWLAYMHGLNAGRSWLWGREASGEPQSRAGSGYPGTYAQQPAILNEMHETVIDLNYHSEEITTIQQQDKPLRIYYSITNAINRSSYMEDLFKTYESLYFESIPLGFATDSIIIESAPGDWEAILIRESESVTLQEFNTLQAYLDSGGTVIMDDLSFSVDEYGRPLGSLESGNGTLMIASSLADMKSKAMDLISAKGLLPDLLVDETNFLGQRTCLWRCVKNSAGNNVLSLINLGKNESKLKIELNEAKYGTVCTDLINGIRVSPDTVLKPYGILFLEVTDELAEPTDTATHVRKPATLSGMGASLYPNPSSGNFTLELPQLHNQVDLLVHDLAGKKLFSRSYFSTNQISHRMGEHPDGLYIVCIRSENLEQHFFFAKQQIL